MLRRDALGKQRRDAAATAWPSCVRRESVDSKELGVPWQKGPTGATRSRHGVTESVTVNVDGLGRPSSNGTGKKWQARGALKEIGTTNQHESEYGVAQCPPTTRVTRASLNSCRNAR
jgi:hypothetical protein